MKLYLIRHGESKSNYDKKEGNHYFCGQLDVPLTEKGARDAQLLQHHFNQVKIDHIYLSDLTRTRQTYNAIFDKDIPASVTTLLRERSLGQFEGEKVSEIEQNAQFETYFNGGPNSSFRHSFTQKAPEGESYENVFKRVETFFKQELDTSLDTVVIIAHQVVIRCCFVYLGYENKASVIDKQIDNCVPYEIEL